MSKEFDDKLSSLMPSRLINRLVVPQKVSSPENLTMFIQELRKLGLRVIVRVNGYRQRGLLTAQYKPFIKPGYRGHDVIAHLYEENLKEWSHSMQTIVNDSGQFMEIPMRTRFTDERILKLSLFKSKTALKNAFKLYKDAVMITLTVPHIFPLVIPIEMEGKILGYILLQDSIISELKNYMLDWVRQMWKDRKIKTFTAYEYHRDYVLHLHIIIFGIPYLIDWSRKFGKKKEDALTYYVRKYKIELPPEAEKTQISKHIFTALLDKWLIEVLERFDSVLQINLLEAYISYKKEYNLQGPINEIHKIKDGQWDGEPPKDAIIQYSSDDMHNKVLPPDSYIIKYLLKIYSMVSKGEGINKENQAKIYGYWLFGKRFNSYSLSLLLQEKITT
jgi:hypothetical protein